MLMIDGSYGEGGGQILRSALALSIVTGESFRIEQIRANRSRPGLMRQHLTAVQAAAAISGAVLRGAAIGSRELTFEPGSLVPGEHVFSIGTAGSATLVLQTILPPLLLATAPSTLVLEGGTHNPHAPPFDFLAKAFLPLLRRMGATVTATLERPGFYPAGGGRVRVCIQPATALDGFQLDEPLPIHKKSARALVAHLPRSIAERELAVIGEGLGLSRDALRVEEVENSQGPGNVVLIELANDWFSEVIVGFGERGVRAEAVADNAVQEAKRYLAADVPIGEHLADQLLLPLALAGKGTFLTMPLSTHSLTNIAVIQQFLDVPVTADARGENQVLVRVG